MPPGQNGHVAAGPGRLGRSWREATTRASVTGQRIDPVGVPSGHVVDVAAGQARVKVPRPAAMAARP